MPGRNIQPKPADLRIVSLLPSATEIVCALGGAENLVGISHECDFPEAIRNRPALTRTRVELGGSSHAIDAAVRTVIRDALSIYEVDGEKLAALEPDVIVTQDLCEVCAVSLEDVRSAVARLAHRDEVSIINLRPTRLRDILEDIERVAAGIGRSDEGRIVRSALEARIRAIAGRSEGVSTRPRVVSVEWIDPLMLGGTWMPELIELAGAIAVGATAGQPAHTLGPGQLERLRPDVVVIKPCGFSLERALAERPVLERVFGETVGPSARIYVTDGNAFFNRPGPRIVESLEILAACIHPGVFEDFALEHADAIFRFA